MKKYFKIISLVLVCSLFVSCRPAAGQVKSSQSQAQAQAQTFTVAPAENKQTYEIKQVTALLFDENEETTFDCIFKDDIPVPYVRIAEYISVILKDSVTSEINDGVNIITGANGTMVVDPEKDTIHFDRYEKFFSISAADKETIKNHPIEYCRQVDVEYIGEVKPIDFDLGKYKIDIIQQDEYSYMPITALSHIGGVSFLTGIYADGKISFNPASDNPLVDCTAIYNNLTRSQAEIDYTYKDLCFFMDYFYGCPPKCVLSASIKEKGFDKTLETYSEDTALVKKMLISEESADLVLGLNILENIMNDGGHVSLVKNAKSAEGSPVNTRIEELLKDESDPRAILASKWKAESFIEMGRRDSIEKYLSLYESYTPLFKETDSEEDDFAYYEYDDTGIYVFDSFDEETLVYLKKAMDLANDHGMKNFILDIADNGGGSASILAYILRILLGENGYYYISAPTGNRAKDVYAYDLDQDGAYEDVKETFNYKFNFGILCSSASFSCGNSLPCYAKEAGIPILGETSGGGTCLLGAFALPNAITNSISSYTTIQYKNGGDMDGGATPDYDLTKKTAEGEVDYTDFFNFALLDSIMDKHYASSY